MWHRSLAVLIALSVIAAGGCGGPDKPPPGPVLMQTYHALTNEPLGAVAVTRWDYEYGRGDQSVYPTPAGATGSIDGLIGAPIGEWAPSFIFSKDGFEPAEVRVEGDQAYVAAPSAGNRWSRRGDLFDWIFRRLPRLKYEQFVPARPLIRVPMWPKTS